MTNIWLKWSGVYLLIMAIFPSFGQAAGLLDELAPAQRDQVIKGSQVAVMEDVEGNAWPRIKVYRVVSASPEEVMAVFTDFPNAKDYVPNLLKSDVSQKVSPKVVDVDYALDIPIFPDEYYTTRNTLSTLPDGGFRVDWKLLRAVQTKDTVGNLRVTPYEGKALICYTNLVTPGSMMAGLLRGKAIEQMKQSVQAIACHVEKQKAENPAELAREVKALQAVFQ